MTLGIVGLGRVGSEVAHRAQAFAMRVVAFDPFISEEYAAKLGVEVAPLDELLKQCDFISVHTPLTDGTRSLIGPEELALCKPTVRFINAARGGIIDEQALLDAVEAGRIAGGAVDVFTQEPINPDNPLLKRNKIVVTPHLGASTEEAQTKRCGGRGTRGGGGARRPARPLRREHSAHRAGVYVGGAALPAGGCPVRQCGDAAL